MPNESKIVNCHFLNFKFQKKILAMHDVIRLKQVEHVKNEKNILQARNTDISLIGSSVRIKISSILPFKFNYHIVLDSFTLCNKSFIL